MRIRILPLPADEFVLVVDHVSLDLGVDPMWRSLREEIGARSVIVSDEAIDLDDSALVLSEGVITRLGALAGA